MSSFLGGGGSGGSSSITINTTPIVGGTTGDILYDNAGTVGEAALTALLDTNFGSAQGDILYRDAAAWKVLAPGTSGWFLETQGSAANPVWAAAPSGGITIDTTTITGGTTGHILYDNAGTVGEAAALTVNSLGLVVSVDGGGAGGAAATVSFIDSHVGGQSWSQYVVSGGTQDGSLVFQDNTAGVVELALSPFGQMVVRSGGVFGFGNSAGFPGYDNIDTGISRNGAGIIAFGNGTAGDTSATLQCGTLITLTGNTAFTSTFNSLLSTYRYNNMIDLGGGFGSGTFPNIEFALNGGSGGGGVLDIIASYNVFNTGDIGFLFQPPGTGGTVFEDTGSGLYFSTVIGNGPIFFAPGRTVRGKITATGSFILQANGALATNATDGFTYVPTCAGTPTGTPTTQTGAVPIVYDTTNNKFYCYNSNWKAEGNLQINTQTASYVLAISDQEGIVEMNAAGANAVTVPANATVAFPIGTRIMVVQVGAGQTTVQAAAGVTGDNFGALSAQWDAAWLYKRATNEWVMTLG